MKSFSYCKRISVGTIIYLVMLIIGINVKESVVEHYLQQHKRQFMHLFGFLDHYWNFYSYDILYELIKNLSEKEMLFISVKQDMEVYANDMNRFRKATQFIPVMEYITLCIPPEPTIKVTVMLNWTGKETLEDLEQLRKNLSHALDVNKCNLFLTGTQRGSIILTWEVIPTDNFFPTQYNTQSEDVYYAEKNVEKVYVLSSTQMESTSVQPFPNPFDSFHVMFHDLYIELPFCYTGKATEVYWKEAGIGLFFPSAEVQEKIMFSIKVVNDDFIVKPENEEISAVYEISASNILPKEVKVRMQHCAVVEEGDYLEFMVAHGDSPYCFKPLSGGVFPVNEFYGDISMNRFSKMKIDRKRRQYISTQFAVHIFYCKDGSIDFVVTKNLGPHIAAVKKRYYDATSTDECTMTCPSSTSKIVLLIPKAEANEWSIQPVFEPPKIEMQTIDRYRPGKVIPSIKLNIRWNGEKPQQESNVKIEVKGGDFKSFYLRCKPIPTLATSLQSQPQYQLYSQLKHDIPSSSLYLIPFPYETPTLQLLHHFRTHSCAINIIEIIGRNYRKLGICLLCDDSGEKTDNLEAQHRPDQNRITEAIFQKWIQGTGKMPRSWETLITVLKEIELLDLARDIESGLQRMR